MNNIARIFAGLLIVCPLSAYGGNESESSRSAGLTKSPATWDLDKDYLKTSFGKLDLDEALEGYSKKKERLEQSIAMLKKYLDIMATGPKQSSDTDLDSTQKSAAVVLGFPEVENCSELGRLQLQIFDENLYYTPLGLEMAMGTQDQWGAVDAIRHTRFPKLSGSNADENSFELLASPKFQDWTKRAIGLCKDSSSKDLSFYSRQAPEMFSYDKYVQ